MASKRLDKALEKHVKRFRAAGGHGDWDLCVYCGHRNGFGSHQFHLHVCESDQCRAKSDAGEAGKVSCDCTYEALSATSYKYQGKVYTRGVM